MLSIISSYQAYSTQKGGGQRKVPSPGIEPMALTSPKKCVYKASRIPGLLEEQSIRILVTNAKLSVIACLGNLFLLFIKNLNVVTT